MKISEAGRTLEEARKLVEQSFGNYVGSNVMQAAKEELIRIQNEIEMLTSDISDEAIDKNTRKVLSEVAYKEIADLQEELRVTLLLISIYPLACIFFLGSFSLGNFHGSLCAGLLCFMVDIFISTVWDQCNPQSRIVLSFCSTVYSFFLLFFTWNS